MTIIGPKETINILDNNQLCINQMKNLLASGYWKYFDSNQLIDSLNPGDVVKVAQVY